MLASQAGGKSSTLRLLGKAALAIEVWIVLATFH
jgi:hypothetical protein